MNYLQQLRERRDAAVKKAKDLHDKAKGESRSLTAEETTAYDAAMAEVRSLATDIKRAEEQEELEREGAANTRSLNTHNTQEARDLSKYSMTAVFRSAAAGTQLTGLEGEMDVEAKKEAREAGVQILGHGIPSMVLEYQRRDNTITEGTQPEDGRILVSKEIRPLMELLREALVVRQLGATILPNMSGDVSFPRMTQGATSTWKGETETLDKSNIKFGGIELSPKRLGTYITVSKQFLLQTPASTEPMLRQDIIDSASVALDKAIINGDGTKKPLGILNTSGIGAVAIGTNGGALTRSKLLALMAAISRNNASVGSLGFLMNTDSQFKLMDTLLDSGSGRFVMEEVERLLGYKVGVTNTVTSDLTKGTGTGLSSVIFGNWKDLVVAQWGGFDITVDNITGAKDGEINYILNSFWDAGVRRPQSFAAIKDANNA